MGLRGILQGISQVETNKGSTDLTDTSIERIALSYLETRGENVPRAVLNRVSGIVLLESTFPGDVKRLHDAVDALVGKAELPFGAESRASNYRTEAVRDSLLGATVALERFLETPEVASKLRDAYGYEAGVALKTALAHLKKIDSLDAMQALEPGPGYTPENKTRREWVQEGVSEVAALVAKLDDKSTLRLQLEGSLAAINQAV